MKDADQAGFFLTVNIYKPPLRITKACCLSFRQHALVDI
jgi:hypothetical protein